MQLQNGTSKHNQHSLSRTRKKYRDIYRKQQLQNIFQSIRKTLIETKNQQFTNNQEPLYKYPYPINPQHYPIPQYLQIPPQFLQLFKYYNSTAQYNNLNIKYNQLEHMKPIIEQIMPEYKLQKINQNVYFEKEGYIIYKNQLGKGSFSTVWEGISLMTKEKIAAKQVKILLQNEIRCLANLKSKFIVKIYKIIKHEQKHFIILQYCDNNLKEQLDNCSYNREKVFHYFGQLIEGMDLLQTNNIIHRDLKFQNILVKDNNIKIADFGLAKFMEDQLEIESRRCGTPYTMAPEIYFSKEKTVPYTIKSDIWSLGVLLHLMLYRKHPFNGKGEDLKYKKRLIVMRRYNILDKLIDKCLEYNPRERISWEQFKHIYSQHKRQQVQKDQQQQINGQEESPYPSLVESQIKSNRKKGSKKKYNLQYIKKQQIFVQKFERIASPKHKIYQHFKQYQRQSPPKKQHQKNHVVKKQYQPLKIHRLPDSIEKNKKKIIISKQQKDSPKQIQSLIPNKITESIKLPNNPQNNGRRQTIQILFMFLFICLIYMVISDNLFTSF